MSRATEVARTFIADETLSRDVETLAAAVDSADVPYVPIEQLLAVLHTSGGLTLDEFAARTQHEDTVNAALVRLQDLGLVHIASSENGDRITLTPEGALAAECRVDAR